MDNTENSFNFVIILKFIAPVLCFIIIKYHWNRRWLYYHASKIPGPFAFPIIGSVHLFLGHKGLTQVMDYLIKSQPPIFKMWFGPELVIITSRARDSEIILSKYTDRGRFSDFGKSLLGEGLLCSQETKWKKSRKIINPTFSSQVLHSFIGDFNKHSTKLAQKLQNYCHLDSFDILLNVFCCLVDTACESLLDIDANLVSGQENYVNNCIKVEQLTLNRVMKLWCHSDFIWKLTSQGKEVETTCKKVFDFIRKLVDVNKASQKSCEGNSNKKTRFLNQLLDLSNSHFDDQLILEETQTIILTASETTALTVSTVLVVLGILQQVEEKIHYELFEVFGKDNREPTLEDLNKMVYLEAVIKETMRLFPVIPFAFRKINEDVQLDGYIVPAGSSIAMQIKTIHTSSEYWTKPDQFNPDRFLYKEESSLPKCAYLPFSYGPRNCIGSRFAMLSMKSLLSTVLRHYRIESIGYKSLEEFEFVFHGAVSLKNGYKVKISER